MITLNNITREAAATCLIATAGDGKRFVFYEDAFLDWDYREDKARYTARAFCPDDPPDEDGHRPGYDLYFEIVNPDAEDAAETCDWDAVADYRENGNWIDRETAAALAVLAR